MTHSLITRLVVGDPTTLGLGRPVGQTLAKASGAALRWRGGTWVGAGTPRLEWLARLLRRRQPQAIELRTAAATTRGRRRVVAAALVALSVGAAIPLLMLTIRGEPSAPKELPISPATATAPVRVVTAAYVAPQPSPAPEVAPPLPIAASDGAAAPLPFAPPAADQEPAAKVRDLPKAAPLRLAEKPAVATPKPPVSAPKEPPAPAAKAGGTQREQQPASAVVLDEAAPRAQHSAAAASAAQQVAKAPAPAPAAVTTAPAKPAVAAPAPKPALERGTGLIAITPDGKVAVFTNPKTRLPQQFKIGDQLPSGDTLRAIDAKEGKALSSSKEYTLD